LKRRPERTCAAAEQQGCPQAAQEALAREDHQRRRDQALAARQPFVPAAGVVDRQRRTAETGDEAAVRSGATRMPFTE